MAGTREAGDERLDRLAERLVPRAAEDRLGGPVEVDDQAVLVGREDRVRREVDRRAKPVLDLLSRFLGPGPCQELSDLPSDRVVEGLELVLAAADGPGEEVDDADDLLAVQDRKRGSSAEAAAGRSGGAAE
jgi:hypothetical protein